MLTLRLSLIDFGGRVPLFVLEFFGLGTNHHFPPDSEPACFPFEIRILPHANSNPGKAENTGTVAMSPRAVRERLVGARGLGAGFGEMGPSF